MNIIDQAADRLRGRWQQGGYGDVGGDGPVCVVGAVVAVAGSYGFVSGDLFPSLTAEATLSDISRIVQGETRHRDLVTFNDDPATTEEDVLLLLKKASVLYDERHPS